MMGLGNLELIVNEEVVGLNHMVRQWDRMAPPQKEKKKKKKTYGFIIL